MRRRGHTGFYCSKTCLILDTRIGYAAVVTDEIVREDEESCGTGWEIEERI